MRIEKLLQAASDHLEPESGAKERVRMMMRKEMRAESLLKRAAKETSPTALTQSRIWASVSQSLRRPAADLLTRLGELLHPTHAQLRSVRHTMMNRMAEPSTGWLRFPAMRFAASLAVFALLVRISPLLFLAPHSNAESVILLLPTRGQVETSENGQWQPLTDDTVLTQSKEIRTQDGEATVVLHDDGNVRLGSDTDVILRDTADRPDAASELGPSITLLSGKIWVQGLVPQPIRGIVVATPQGDITVNEGSVSIEAGSDGNVTVSVWDRHVSVDHNSQDSTLVSGEFARLTDAPVFLVQQSPASAARADWVSQNLDRDAAHRKEIAEQQQQRRVADAGILPNSPLYPVKRIAEQMDLLMTFDETDKAKKQLAFASTRLDEATALIAQGATEDSQAPLQEYQTALIAVATGTGSDPLIQQLVTDEVTQSVADSAAASPTDSGYVIKKAVLEASAALPDAQIGKTDVEGTILVDTLDAMQNAAQSGDIAQVQQTFTDLKPYLTSIKEGKSGLPLDTRKEALALLQQFAVTVADRDQTAGDVDDSLVKDAAQYLPQTAAPAPAQLTDDQIAQLVDQMKLRIYSYKLPRSRWDQLQTEFKSIQDNPDRGRILRALYHALPQDGLAPYVRTEIQKVREEQGQQQ